MAMLEKIMKDRMEKIAELKKLGVDPYPSKSGRTHLASEIVEDFLGFKDKKVVVAGRIMSWRDIGKLIFAKLRDASGEIQLYLRKEKLEKIWSQLKLYDLGDFVDATGVVTKTQTGEISVEITELKMLVKSIYPLPEKW